MPPRRRESHAARHYRLMSLPLFIRHAAALFAISFDAAFIRRFAGASFMPTVLLRR